MKAVKQACSTGCLMRHSVDASSLAGRVYAIWCANDSNNETERENDGLSRGGWEVGSSVLQSGERQPHPY
jgi:hypothetical protein